MHEGDFLKEYLKKQRSSPPKLADQLGIARSSVYYQLDLEQLSSSFVKKLENAGINIFSNDYWLFVYSGRQISGSR